MLRLTRWFRFELVKLFEMRSPSLTAATCCALVQWRSNSNECYDAADWEMVLL